MRHTGSRLDDFVRLYVPKPFDWATNNCAHFVLSWVNYLGQEGITVLPPFADFTATRRWFVEQNKSFEQLIDAIPYLTKVLPSFVQIGDIVLYVDPTRDLQATGIYLGPQVIFLGSNGLVFDIVQITAAWRVKNV
jgi:hypothetical protein